MFIEQVPKPHPFKGQVVEMQSWFCVLSYVSVPVEEHLQHVPQSLSLDEQEDQTPDEQVFVPVKTAQKLLLGVNHLAFIRAKIDKEENIGSAISRIKNTVRFRHNIKDPAKDDFSIRSTDQALDILGTITQALTYSMLLCMV